MSERPPSGEQVRRWLSEDRSLSAVELTERLRRERPLTSAAAAGASVSGVLRQAIGVGPLGRLLDTPEVTDICVNGPGEVWADAGGAWRRTGIVLDSEELAVVVERLLAHTEQRLDRLHPMVDARLPDGSRINVVGPPVAAGVLLTVRRFGPAVPGLESFGTSEEIGRLRAALADRDNLLIAGATGAGKTTLVSALLAELPVEERVVVAEDTAELRLPGPGSVRLETRAAGPEGTGEVTLRSLVRNALRMRPDRIVVGEVRGPEAIDLILAITSGHRGSLATLHADGPNQAIQRLQVLALLGGELGPPAVLPLVREAIDVVVHVARRGAERRIASIVDLGGGAT